MRSCSIRVRGIFHAIFVVVCTAIHLRSLLLPFRETTLVMFIIRPTRRRRNTPMKKLFVAALFASTIAGFGAANAMSPAPVAPANCDVIHVAGGCGPGFHRGAYGRCR